jgi:hypothetical protein
MLDKGLLIPMSVMKARCGPGLDIDALPTPLRLLAYLSDDWRLASEWYTWPL